MDADTTALTEHLYNREAAQKSGDATLAQKTDADLASQGLDGWLEMRVIFTDLRAPTRGYHCHLFLSPSGVFLVRPTGREDAISVEMGIENMRRWVNAPFKQLLKETRLLFQQLAIKSGLDDFLEWQWSNYRSLDESHSVLVDWPVFTRFD